MSNDTMFKKTTQSKMKYTKKGEFGRPFISMIIDKGDGKHTDDFKWSFDLTEIKLNYDVMKEHFITWFCDAYDVDNYYIDKAHKQYILDNGSAYYDSDYLWNRLFVEDEKIRDVIANYEPPTFEVISGADFMIETNITRTKRVIFRKMNDGTGHFLLQMHADVYAAPKYNIHTLGDAPYGTDVSKVFFRWFNHMREKGWFSMDHLNDFIDVVERNWKLPFTSIR